MCNRLVVDGCTNRRFSFLEVWMFVMSRIKNGGAFQLE